MGRGGGWQTGGRSRLRESTATSSCSLHQELLWHQWKWSREQRERHLHAGLHESGPLPNTGITEPPFYVPHSLLPQNSLIKLRELEARRSHQSREAVVWVGDGAGRSTAAIRPAGRAGCACRLGCGVTVELLGRCCCSSVQMVVIS